MYARKTNHCSYDFSLFFVDPFVPYVSLKKGQCNCVDMCWPRATLTRIAEFEAIAFAAVARLSSAIVHVVTSMWQAFQRHPLMCTKMPSISKPQIHRQIASHFVAVVAFLWSGFPISMAQLCLCQTFFYLSNPACLQSLPFTQNPTDWTPRNKRRLEEC